MTAVHVIVPDGIDDPARPSGGNVYDRRATRGLATLGWRVREHAVAGSWPYPDAEALAALERVVAGVPDGAALLVDGLVASTAPAVLVPHAGRLRLVVLVHLPLARDDVDDAASVAERARERAVLEAASAVVTTSAWTRRRIVDLHGIPAARIHVARPGVDAVDVAPRPPDAGALVCVAAVIPGKGHDVLLDALATVADLPWRCACVGSVDRDPAFAALLRRQAARLGIGDRVAFPGPRTGDDLDRTYATAGLLVLASRGETYGMVVAEALAHGVPVVASDVGGISEALGHGADGTLPGLLVPPGDAAALGWALRAWLADADLRARLRQAARERREALHGWSTTATHLAHALAGVAA